MLIVIIVGDADVDAKSSKAGSQPNTTDPARDGVHVQADNDGYYGYQGNHGNHGHQWSSHASVTSVKSRSRQHS